MGENKTLRAAILTLGCRVNQYESDAIAGILEKNGFRIVPFGDPCDAVIVNTCTVTAESDRKSRQHIRRAVQAADGAPVIVTGCFAQIAPEETVKIPGVSAVVGNGEKSRIPSLVQSLILDKAAETLLFVSDISEAEYDPLTLDAEYKRDVAANLPIHPPYNYYPGDDPTKDPVVRWRSAGMLIYTNWLNYYVYQSTPYDLKDLKDADA